MTSKDPYLSIVATARNDNHGGNLLHRMQIFINGILHQCRRHGLSAELIIVEWNPPGDRPRLMEALDFSPIAEPTIPVRVIEVPPQLHARYSHSDKLPLFQMIAKNVGVRRSRGAFVLATNIDLLFSDELSDFLASRRLNEQRIYRLNRYDVLADIPESLNIEDQLEFCRRNIFRICTRSATIDLRTGRKYLMYDRIRYTPRPIDAVLRRVLPDRLQDWWMYQEHRRVRTARPRLHTNTCGDFTLLARDQWFRLRGYPELEIFSMHLDSLFCYMAHYSRVREKILRDPMRIYHIDHQTGWTPEMANDKTTWIGRLDPDVVPQLTMDQFDSWVGEMRRKSEPLTFNSELWGLAEEDLEETIFPEHGDAMSVGKSL